MSKEQTIKDFSRLCLEMELSPNSLVYMFNTIDDSINVRFNEYLENISINELALKGYIIIKDYTNPYNYTISNKFNSFVNKIEVKEVTPILEKPIVAEKSINQVNQSTDKVEDWIEEYRTLFAPAKTSGGRPIKGNRDNCIFKMKKLIKDAKITKEEIMEATQAYMREMKKQNYQYTQCADYFIFKGSVTNSNLLSFIENLRENPVSNINQEDDDEWI